MKIRLYEMIEKKVILIETSGAKIGQINALSVIQYGSYSFAHPTKITVRVRLGHGKVIDIQRETKLGGSIHSKGVMILSGFLFGRYVKNKRFSLWATIAFEQTYSMVDGDSASAGELCALLSALSEVPIKQNIAMTGSINQQGEIQAIGKVNEKIEGFFDICKAQGLTGDQGVLIPESNLKHLMLREDVVEAVAKKLFFVMPIKTVDEAISILTGVSAGEPDDNGDFPKGSINYLVEKRLESFSDNSKEKIIKEAKKKLE